jgi:hypothetical protein
LDKTIIKSWPSGTFVDRGYKMVQGSWTIENPSVQSWGSSFGGMVDISSLYEINYVDGNMYVAEFNNESNIIVVPPPTVVNVDEYINISRGIDIISGKTTGKTFEYNVSYRIKGSHAENGPISYMNGIKYELVNAGTGISWVINDTLKIKNVKVNYDIYTENGGYLEGNASVFVTCDSDAIGIYTLKVDAVNSENYQFEDTCTFELKAFIDSNSDGIDDQTGETSNPDSELGDYVDGAPQRTDYGEDIIGNVQYGFAKLMYYIEFPFKMLNETIFNVINKFNESFVWLNSFNTFIKGIFSYLPVEVVSVIIIAFICSTIALIYRVFRGA